MFNVQATLHKSAGVIDPEELKMQDVYRATCQDKILHILTTAEGSTCPMTDLSNPRPITSC
jgi:hypothetical protein